MPENSAEMVDSINAQGAVDSATEKHEEIPSAEESPEISKTYTEAEVDARIKARIDKQRAKYDLDMQELRQQVEELTRRSAEVESERDALKAERERAAWLNAASAETGVDAGLLRGNTQDEILEHARAIRAAFNAPVVRDFGERKDVSPTKESILSIKSDKERLAAIKENIDLF